MFKNSFRPNSKFFPWKINVTIPRFNELVYLDNRRKCPNAEFLNFTRLASSKLSSMSVTQLALFRLQTLVPSILYECKSTICYRIHKTLNLISSKVIS